MMGPSLLVGVHCDVAQSTKHHPYIMKHFNLYKFGTSIYFFVSIYLLFVARYLSHKVCILL